MYHMEEIQSAFHDKDLVRIFLLKMGICDDKTLSGIEFADDVVVKEFLMNIFMSEDFIKFMKYLRS